MAVTLIESEQATRKVILCNVSWGTYQSLLAELGEHSQPRYNYDRRTLAAR